VGDGGTRFIREPQFAGFKGLQGRTPFRRRGLEPESSRKRGTPLKRRFGELEAGTAGDLAGPPSGFQIGAASWGWSSTVGRNPGRRLATNGEVLTGARDAQTGWNAGKNPGPGGVVPGRAQAGAWERLRAVGQACLGTETSERPGGAQAGRSGVHEHGRHQAPLSSAGRSPGAQTLAPERGVVKGVVDSGAPLVARQ